MGIHSQQLMAERVLATQAAGLGSITPNHLPKKLPLAQPSCGNCSPWQVIGQPGGGIRAWEPAHTRPVELLLTN